MVRSWRAFPRHRRGRIERVLDEQHRQHRDEDPPRRRQSHDARLGPELAAACEIDLIVFGAPVESPADGPLFDLLVSTIRDHDPDGIPLPVMAPFATDAKFTDALGVPTYGFSPLRLDPEERFLERFHGVDERRRLSHCAAHA